jgi:hypothetical protein
MLLPLLLLFTLFTLDSLHVGSAFSGPPPGGTFGFILQRQAYQRAVLETILAQPLAFIFEWLLIEEQTLSIRWRSVAAFVQRRLEVSDSALAADTDDVLCPEQILHLLSRQGRQISEDIDPATKPRVTTNELIWWSLQCLQTDCPTTT